MARLAYEKPSDLSAFWGPRRWVTIDTIVRTATDTPELGNAFVPKSVLLP